MSEGLTNTRTVSSLIDVSQARIYYHGKLRSQQECPGLGENVHVEDSIFCPSFFKSDKL